MSPEGLVLPFSALPYNTRVAILQVSPPDNIVQSLGGVSRRPFSLSLSFLPPFYSLWRGLSKDPL